jgi:DNA-binding MurR/RpiR family transcriptional regulator
LDRFIEAILAARRVTIVGVRFVSPLADYLRYSLRKILPHVQAFFHADSTHYDDLCLMGDGDLLIALAFARYSAELVELLRYARQRGLRVLAITDAPISPIVPYAEIALFARGGQLDFVGSLAAPAALINCIVSEVGVRRGERAIERLQRLEESAASSGAFVHSGPGTSPHFIAWPDAPLERDEGPARQERKAAISAEPMGA